MKEEAKQVLITNPSLNSMIKPNNISNEYTVSSGQYTDSGILIKQGHMNHQKAMIFDIVYDRIYRMLNQIPNSDNFVQTQIKYGKDHDQENLRLLSRKKLEFLSKIANLLNYKDSIPWNSKLRNELLYAPPDLIDDAFPLEFSLQYRNELECQAEKRGNFDVIVDLFKTYDINKHFFSYLLEKVFYGKQPFFNQYNLNVDLESIFDNKERSVYLLKQWFKDAQEFHLSMTYPITCFVGNKPSFTSKGTYMFPIQHVIPFSSSEFNKSTMTVSLSLRNHFMALFSHDAKMCAHKFIPTRLYKMNNNEFFLGKNLINNVYYHSKKKVYTTRSNYKMNELFRMLNLPIKDIRNNNTANRRKAIIKALGKLNDNRLINIDKLNSERLVLNGVWNINRDNCNQRV